MGGEEKALISERVSDDNKLQYLNEFCHYLNEVGIRKNIMKKGRVFEYFLQYYLEKLGFKNIILTPSGSDGGIDLIADLYLDFLINDVEIVDRYYISAKQFKPNEKMQPYQIRDLRGAIETGKGIFITTGKVTDNAKRNALYSKYVLKTDPISNVQKSIPIYVIDYKPLIDSFIDLELEFVKVKEIDDKNATISLDKNKLKKILTGLLDGYVYNDKKEVIKMPATIPKSHIRRNVLLIPSPFKKYIVDKKINIRFDDEQEMEERDVNKACTYISKGMAAIYSKYKQNVDSIELEAIWEIDTEQNGIHVTIRKK